jgi:diaminohydroxyphosphoribosylaminopyrimidine deaminase / 5-amino-6-(5-phosphoribosylamino)uracil reductase
MTASQKKELMKRCLELALQGRGYVSPNPRVGALLVNNNRVIATGFHERYGGPHAEVNAITFARKKGIDLSSSTLFVNLEPCSHYGKTPPCTDAIINSGIKKVIIGDFDPNPLVSGRGVQQLKKNGVIVQVGILAEQARKVNEQYLKFIRTGYPFVALKVAQTKNHMIAKRDGTPLKISSNLSQRYSHSLRLEYDGILVGASTVRNDNPRLTVRNVKGRNPYRIVIDGNLSSPPLSHVFSDSSAKKTILYTSLHDSSHKRRTIREIAERGVTVVQYPSKIKRIPIHWILHDLCSRGIISLLVEGGSMTHTEFLNTHKVDKVFIITNPQVCLDGIKSFVPSLKRKLYRVRRDKLGRDKLIEGYF